MMIKISPFRPQLGNWDHNRVKVLGIEKGQNFNLISILSHSFFCSSNILHSSSLEAAEGRMCIPWWQFVAAEFIAGICPLSPALRIYLN